MRRDKKEYDAHRSGCQRSAQELSRTHGQEERAALPGFIMPGSTLKDDRLVPAPSLFQYPETLGKRFRIGPE
jgi:hypothetical protein